MNFKKYLLYSIGFTALFSCATKNQIIDTKKANNISEINSNENKSVAVNSIKLENVPKTPLKQEEANDTTFVNLKDYSNDFVYNMKYATADNFLKSKVYDCEACYLRYKTVKALLNANEKFLKKGFRIMLFDCYRPLAIQKKMWEIVSNPNYVADPKKGSIHNRGGAVDITLVDLQGKELDMGTPFDFFGIEASHNFEQLSDEVKANRKLLRKIMTQNNFKIFESEWWHYNLKNAQKDPISNFIWNCN
jgi:D-alanyl-D-alanine dipeptidase